MIFLETLITILFYLFLPFYFVERVVHKKSYGWKEKFGGVNESFCANLTTDDKVIHIHCCSVGESLAIENLLKAIRKEFPNNKIVVTTFTYAGQQIAQKKFKDFADLVTYFPFDMPISVNRFLDRIKPSISLIVETEIWPYFAYSCKKRNIPLCMINARISDKTYKQYKNMRFFFKHVFKNYKGVYAQSLEDKEKFITVGMDSENVEMMGNLKFDVESSSLEYVDIGQANYRVILAGSTHSIENEIILKIFKILKEKYSDLRLLIAPRHLERVNDIKDLSCKYELAYGVRSNNDKFSKEKDVIILDTLGELKKMYSVADIAFIGGSFNKTGGHNPLEATIYQKPVVSGPAVFNFKDIYDILQKSGAGKVVKTETELLEFCENLLNDKNEYQKSVESCKNVFDAQHGAINFVIKKITELIY